MTHSQVGQHNFKIVELIRDSKSFFTRFCGLFEASQRMIIIGEIAVNLGPLFFVFI